MKNLIHVSIFALALGSLNSCASISNVADDDVYVVKPSQIPMGESLDDETSYMAYKYKKDQNNNLTTYRNPNVGAFGMGYAYGYRNYNDPFLFNPYMYNPYGFYDPYGYYSPYGHYGSGLGYIPGYGWSYIGPNPYYGGYYGYHNYFGNSIWGNPYYGYGSGYGYYGGGMYGSGFWGGNPYYGGYYGGYYGNNNNGWGNGGNAGGGSTSYNHYRGPRGGGSGGGVVTRRDMPGTVKMGTTPSIPLGNTSSTTVASSRETAGKTRPVGNEAITMDRPHTTSVVSGTRSPEVRQGMSNDNNVTGTTTRLNRPGRVEYNEVPASSGRGSVNVPSNPTRTYNGASRNSGSTEQVPSRNSGSNQQSPSRNSGGEYSRPSRTIESTPTRTREYSAPSSPSRGSSGSGSSGSGSRGGSVGGSTGGGRR